MYFVKIVFLSLFENIKTPVESSVKQNEAGGAGKKPRTYRRKARKADVRKAVKAQLAYLRRNIRNIVRMGGEKFPDEMLG